MSETKEVDLTVAMTQETLIVYPRTVRMKIHA